MSNETPMIDAMQKRIDRLEYALQLLVDCEKKEKFWRDSDLFRVAREALTSDPVLWLPERYQEWRAKARGER